MRQTSATPDGSVYTDHQVAGAQEENHTEDVDHAGGENAIPGSKKHRLPHEQLDLPPRLTSLVETLQQTQKSL